MSQEINDLLLSELEEANAYFDILISNVKENSVHYSINDLIIIENNSYHISYDAITKMNDILVKYDAILKENEDFFVEDSKIKVKLLFLYLVSIIMISIFCKTVSHEKLNEIWYAMIGLVFGTINTSILYNNLNHNRYDDEKNRRIMNEIFSLQDDYNKNFEIARNEITYMFSLNRNLDNDEEDIKKLIKK